jgi:predicted ATPase
VFDAAFVKSVRLVAAGDGARRSGYPWELPAVAQLAEGVVLDARVTYLIGENGSGKSTLLSPRRTRSRALDPELPDLPAAYP